MNKKENRGTPPGLAPRVAVSIIVFFGWLIFGIIFAAFYAPSFSLFQKISIILVAFLVGIAILGAMWAAWGIKFGKEWAEKGRES